MVMLKEHQALRAHGRAQLACICLCMFIWSVQAQALEPLQAPDESADRAQAMRQLRVLVETAEPAVATQAADLLIEALYDDQQYGQAWEVAQIALRRDPDSALAYRFSRIPPDTQSVPNFSFDLGYRFEYDDNITFPDDDLASGEEDFRHVLMADILY